MTNKRKSSKRIIPKVCLFLIIAIIGFNALLRRPLHLDEAIARNHADSMDIDNSISDYYTSEPTNVINIADILDTGYLNLINRDHSFAGEPGSGLIVSAWPTVAVRETTITLHESALQAVAKMFDSARSADIESLFVSSGCRSYTEQLEVYQSISDKSLVMPPGYSEHHTGLAADILAVGIPQSEMSASQAGRWLAENSWRYGLILRYPNDKQHITGVAYEPWHFRYVGRVHAWYMHQHNLVLEEYIELLRESGGISVDFDGKTYYILHRVPIDSMINIPAGLSFNVSSDNKGGYIITAWE